MGFFELIGHKGKETYQRYVRWCVNLRVYVSFQRVSYFPLSLTDLSTSVATIYVRNLLPRLNHPFVKRGIPCKPLKTSVLIGVDPPLGLLQITHPRSLQRFKGCHVACRRCCFFIDRVLQLSRLQPFGTIFVRTRTLLLQSPSSLTK